MKALIKRTKNIFQSTLPTRGSDDCFEDLCAANAIFQSTLPTRGSDKEYLQWEKYPIHFNPRSPRGGATYPRAGQPEGHRISIHAPHEGERLHMYRDRNDGKQFQSTLPTRGSDNSAVRIIAAALSISIHAPHEGERPPMRHTRQPLRVFQSTLPTRGSDPPFMFVITTSQKFQSTLPTRGSDAHKYYDGASPYEFQSTLPTRGSDINA